MDKEWLLQETLESGAWKATLIPQSSIVLSGEFRKMCESNQCGIYGKCWMCPPAIGEINELMKTVRSFSGAILYQTVYDIEDSFDIEGMFEAKKAHARVSEKLEEKIQLQLKSQGTERYLHLTCGGCFLCKTCAIAENKPCRFPRKALSSLEAYGIDVYNTTKDTPLKYINGQNTVTYFGMILFEE